MYQSYAYTSYVWPVLIFSVFSAALGLYAWQRRGIPGAQPLALLMLIVVAWIVLNGLIMTATGIQAKIFWYTLIYACILMPVAVIRLCFALDLAGLGHWLTRRALTLLTIPVLVQLVLVLANDWHHLFWSGLTINDVIQPARGPGFWISAVIGLTLTLATCIILVWLFFRSPPYRGPVVLIIGAILSTSFVALFDVGVNSPASLDFLVLVLSFALVLYALALFRFRLFDPILVARQSVIDQMQEGMLVLDKSQKIVDLNPAIEKILEQPAARLKRQTLAEVLPDFDHTERQLHFGARSPAEITVGTGNARRHYELTLSPLKYHTDLVLGYLLFFHDVTEQKRAQVQLIEQQQALAALNEGEQLARELHDSLGQVLSYASFQLDAASHLIDTGQTAEASQQLARLASIIRETHADVRENILNLRSAPLSQQAFFPALQQYLDGFTNNYGIQTVLIHDEGLAAPALPLDAQMQLFRILQEALSNARKHGHARCVQLTFSMAEQSERMTIQDDGAGFEPAAVTTAPSENHFGLQFMRERAEQLGGHLQVTSTPGAGACIVVEIPQVEE